MDELQDWDIVIFAHPTPLPVTNSQWSICGYREDGATHPSKGCTVLPKRCSGAFGTNEGRESRRFSKKISIHLLFEDARIDGSLHRVTCGTQQHRTPRTNFCVKTWPNPLRKLFTKRQPAQFSVPGGCLAPMDEGDADKCLPCSALSLSCLPHACLLAGVVFFLDCGVCTCSCTPLHTHQSVPSFFLGSCRPSTTACVTHGQDLKVEVA